MRLSNQTTEPYLYTNFANRIERWRISVKLKILGLGG